MFFVSIKFYCVILLSSFNSLDMTENIASFLPIFSAIFFAFGSIFIKRATAIGITPLSVCFTFNAMIFFFYLPMFLYSYNPQTIGMLWIVLACAGIFFVGQIINYIGIYVGDVSLMNPLMGIKILFVVLLASLFSKMSIPTIWIYASIFTAISIIIMGVEKFSFSKKTLLTIACAIGTCLAFAGLDIIMQENAKRMGVVFFISSLSIMLLPLSLPVLPVVIKDFKRVGMQGFKWLAFGLPLIFLHDFLFCLSLSIASGGAVLANILVATRGIMTIAIVFLLGKQLKLPEAKMSKAFAFRRFLGATILFATVAVVIATI